MREEMLKFWNKADPEEAKHLIVNPHTWYQELPSHLQLILESDPTVKNFVYPPGGDKLPAALEIGCGIGRLLKPMAALFTRVIGLDISEKMRDHAKEYLQGLYGDSVQYELIGADSKFRNIPDCSVDFVYSFLVFQHIPSKEIVESYLKEAFRVMKPGGVIRVQNHRGIPNPEGTFQGFAGQMVQDIKKFSSKFSDAGFNVVSTADGLGHCEWLWVTAVKP